ncbi:hypothetical protein ACH5RR_021192 [Cinchona calisaya]|uniref:Transcription repressor n=1 Tax=Cinchona calisaya TaxID=153742 RepID=A0ABD2ZHU7_9GENT
MSSSKTKKMFKTIFTINGGCGCGKPKPKEILEPKPKGIASTSERGGRNSNDGDYTSITYTRSSELHDQFNIPSSSRMINPLPKFRDTVAIVKDSNDPYQDFRQSMIQMILEKEIHSGDDLKELLDCFLHLNSPCHHEVIFKAFMEIWNGVVSKRSDGRMKPNISSKKND